MRPQVVCGIDGSPAAFAAATLAREIARRAELPLEVLHASCARREAEQLARARALQDGLGQGVGPDALLRVEIGDPEERLIEASRRARLLVIATRGRRGGAAGAFGQRDEHASRGPRRRPCSSCPAGR